MKKTSKQKKKNAADSEWRPGDDKSCQPQNWEQKAAWENPLDFLWLYKIIVKYLPDLATFTSYYIYYLHASVCVCILQ